MCEPRWGAGGRLPRPGPPYRCWKRRATGGRALAQPPPHTHTRAHAHTPGRYTRAAGIGLRARPPSRVRTAPGRRVAAGGRRGAALGLPTPVVREVPYGYLLFFIIRGVCVCVRGGSVG